MNITGLQDHAKPKLHTCKMCRMCYNFAKRYIRLGDMNTTIKGKTMKRDSENE